MEICRSKKRKVEQVDYLQPAKIRKAKQCPLPKLARNKLKADQLFLSEFPERPSDSWPSFDNTEGGKIKEIISTRNWTYLCTEAVKYYAMAQAVTCTIDRTRLVRGINNVVFEIAFSDSLYWIVKIRLSEEQDTKTEMLSKIAMIKACKAEDFYTSPYGFCL
jgi:hypothetical protein